MKKNNFVLTQTEKRNVFRDDQNTFKILVASDNHVGFKENDPIRGNDSFEAFEEVLKVAKNEKVDFLLLGGDLFHETNPSQQCLYKMLNLLGNYVLGDGEIRYEMPNYEANFQDFNLNIELPIFVIHGNHDYPSDEYGNLSVIDLLHATKYLNHFGKFSNIEQIKVTPIVFQKGNTTVALYGIGYLKDKYFHKMLEENKIEFVNPKELGYENTVNILVIHQNRYKGIKFGQSYRNCVHPEQFPGWFDFIIRGHEHQQLDELDTMKECPIATIQPGSTILTAIEEVQATPRRAILFEIKGTEATFQDITLIQSYRPVLYENIELTSLLKKAGFNLQEEEPSEIAVEEILWTYIQQSIKNFKSALKENFPDSPQLLVKKPQLRFKIEHSNIDIFNLQKIESNLSQFVANPGEVLKFWKRVIINPRTIKNPKLDEDFIKTLKGKTDFDTIGNDTVKDIKELYEERIKKNRQINCLPSSLIMNTLEKVNLRNRNSQIEDIIKDLQTKLQDNVATSEEKEIKKMNEQYRQQMNNLISKISMNIEEKQNVDNDLKKNVNNNNNNNKIIYKTIMNNQLDELKQNVNSIIRNKVVELFTQDFNQQDDDNDDAEAGADDGQTNNNQNDLTDHMDSENDEDDQDTKKGRGRKSKQPKKGARSNKKQVNFGFDEDDDDEDEQGDDDMPIQKGFKSKFQKKIVKDKNLSNNNNNQKNKNDNLKKGIKREEDSSDQDEDINDKSKKQNKKNNKDQIKINAQPLKIEQTSAFKQKMTYAQMFKKQNADDMEEEYEDQELDQSDDQSQQSDCEFGLEDEKSNKRPSYNIAHISELKKQTINKVSSNLLAVNQQPDKQPNLIKQEQPASFRQSLLNKKKPYPPTVEESQDNGKEADIRNFMKKKISIVNLKK